MLHAISNILFIGVLLGLGSYAWVQAADKRRQIRRALRRPLK